MVDILKKVFYRYQRAMWYAGQTKAEYGKVGSWIPETLMLLTYLTVKGVEVKTWYVPVAYITLMLLASLIGKFLVMIGVVKYTTAMGNEHNEDLQKIIKLLEK